MPYKDIEKRRITRRAYRESHRVSIRTYSRIYNATHPGLHKRRDEKLKNQMYEILGGAKCANPFGQHKEPYTDKRALQFDHINGGGLKEMKEKKGQRAMLIYYRNHPAEARLRLQILCANCNWIKRFENKETRLE